MPGCSEHERMFDETCKDCVALVSRVANSADLPSPLTGIKQVNDEAFIDPALVEEAIKTSHSWNDTKSLEHKTLNEARAHVTVLIKLVVREAGRLFVSASSCRANNVSFDPSNGTVYGVNNADELRTLCSLIQQALREHIDTCSKNRERSKISVTNADRIRLGLWATTQLVGADTTPDEKRAAIRRVLDDDDFCAALEAARVSDARDADATFLLQQAGVVDSHSDIDRFAAALFSVYSTHGLEPGLTLRFDVTGYRVWYYAYTGAGELLYGGNRLYTSVQPRVGAKRPVRPVRPDTIDVGIEKSLLERILAGDTKAENVWAFRGIVSQFTLEDMFARALGVYRDGGGDPNLESAFHTVLGEIDDEYDDDVPF